MNNLKASIIRFNANPSVKSIRDYYSVRSFMEIISKSRNETAHSSFLAWLLEGREFASSSLPLLRFLNLILLNDSKGVVPAELETAILSGKIVLGNTVACTEKCIRDLSDVKSKDRVDIFLNTSLDGVKGFDELSIVVENKLFSEEGMPKAASSQLHDVSGSHAAKYNGLSQTQRYKYAYDDERAFDKHKMVARLFVYLTAPGAPAPVCDSFIHITYQDLLDNVLSPLACDGSLSERSRDTLNDYCRCLSVPSSSDDNDDFTILAVSNAERNRLTEFWAEYRELILATSPVNQSVLSSDSDRKLAADFWDMNRVLFYAVYKAIESGLDVKEKACFESVISKDYTKYSVIIGAKTTRNLSKRKVVLLVVEKLITIKKYSPDNDLFRRMRKGQKLVYTHAEFEAAHLSGEISDDAYSVRYSPILEGTYHVNNQWGVGNFGDFVDAVESSTSIIIMG